LEEKITNEEEVVTEFKVEIPYKEVVGYHFMPLEKLLTDRIVPHSLNIVLANKITRIFIQ